MSDILVFLVWWLAWLAVGGIGWPLSRWIFSEWDDQGYIFAKIIGAAGITYLVWWLGSWRMLPFSWGAIVIAAVVITLAGWWLSRQVKRKFTPVNMKLVLTEEVVWMLLLGLWVWVKAHEPTINGLEKFMDFGFARSALQGQFFPPADMWFAGETINYYYFGHLLMAVVTRLSGLDLGYTFNLMLAALFALTATFSWVIGRKLLEGMGMITKWAGAVLIAFLVTLGGNLHTIYAFTLGYNTDDPQPFWQILVPAGTAGGWENLKLAWNSYWYPNATRFIPYTIHEFPSYSFVVSDIHGHVLDIPLALLAIALLVNMFVVRTQPTWKEAAVFGAVGGMMFMTNALDGPIYMGLLGVMLVVGGGWDRMGTGKWWKESGGKMILACLVFAVTVWPFVVKFKPFVSGIAVNCPPPALANSKLGPFLFEEVEKCQRSPVWMLLVLWGFFLYGATGLVTMVFKKEEKAHLTMYSTWAVFSLGLILFAEFFYFKDIYPLHFRSNTMFKLGYQAFILMSFLTGWMIVRAFKNFNSYKLWLAGILPLLILVAIYPLFSVKSYFGNLRNYQGVWGLSWLETRYPDDWEAIKWLAAQEPAGYQPVIIEAAGDSYTDYNRVSAFSGLPTVAGWAVHEWLWRGGYDPIAKRAEEVRRVYEAGELQEARQILSKYRVKYIFSGDLERQKYPLMNEEILEQLGKKVFTSGLTAIYQVD